MVKIYYTFFSKLYRFYTLFGEKDLPHFFSISLMSLLLYFNISALMSYFEVKFYPNFHDRISIPIGVAMYIMNYFIFLYKKRYVRILEECKPSSNLIVKIIWIVLIIIYFSISIYFWIYTGSQVREINMSLFKN
jgi:hypothetical protein